MKAQKCIIIEEMKEDEKGRILLTVLSRFSDLATTRLKCKANGLSHLLGRHRIMGAIPKDYPRDDGFISGISLWATLRNRQHHDR